MCYTRRKIEGGVGVLRESGDTNFLKPNGQSRNLHIYGNKPTPARQLKFYSYKMINFGGDEVIMPDEVLMFNSTWMDHNNIPVLMEMACEWGKTQN